MSAEKSNKILYSGIFITIFCIVGYLFVNSKDSVNIESENLDPTDLPLPEISESNSLDSGNDSLDQGNNDVDPTSSDLNNEDSSLKKSAEETSSEEPETIEQPSLESLTLNTENINNFQLLEESALESLNLTGLYRGEFIYSDKTCVLEADLKISYTKDSKLGPNGSWDYKVFCGADIMVSNSGNESLKGHLRTAREGTILLTNPSHPNNILEFEIKSESEFDFQVYEMFDGKYVPNGTGTALKN